LTNPTTQPTTTTNGPHQCPECGDTFDTPQNLGKHRRGKHGVAGITSASIRRAKVRQEALKAMLNAPQKKNGDSKKEKTFRCPECGMKFNSPPGLGRHRQSVHGIRGKSKTALDNRKTQQEKKRSQLAKLPKATRHVNGTPANQEAITPSSDPYDIPVAIAFGRFREICAGMAAEFGLSSSMFAARFAELVYRSTLR
jgi:uncharacterized C2H2 Zn-finger protein